VSRAKLAGRCSPQAEATSENDSVFMHAYTSPPPYVTPACMLRDLLKRRARDLAPVGNAGETHGSHRTVVSFGHSPAARQPAISLVHATGRATASDLLRNESDAGVAVRRCGQVYGRTAPPQRVSVPSSQGRVRTSRVQR